MKVKELIEELQKLDPEDDVKLDAEADNPMDAGDIYVGLRTHNFTLLSDWV
jgi:hypothetical protein